MVVKSTKYIDKPSTPKYIWKWLISWYSCTNWNWLLEKSKNMNNIKETNKLTIDTVKAVNLIRFLFNRIISEYVWFPLLVTLNMSVNIINIPSIGINNRANNIII